MRHLLSLSAVLACLAVPAAGQVTVDLRALDALPSRPAAERAPARISRAPSAETASSRSSAQVSAAQPTAPPRQAANTPQAVATAQPVRSQGAAAPAPTQSGTPAAASPAPTIPAAPPAVAELTPVAPAASAASAPPPPPPIEANAATKAAETSNGLRVTFAAGQSDLSPASADAIKQLVASAPSGGTETFNVVAFAAAKADDPSFARRLSLSRALAVRSALMADGVVSSHIYVRALGSQVPEGPADRVDLTMLGGNAPAPQSR